MNHELHEALADAGIAPPNSEFALEKRALEDLVEGRLTRPPFETKSFLVKSFDQVANDQEYLKLRADRVSMPLDILEAFQQGIDSAHSKSAGEVADLAKDRLNAMVQKATAGIRDIAHLRDLARSGALAGGTSE
jgi:hypothetical protein